VTKKYYITDRKAIGGVEPLLESIARNISEGVDLIQIREKDLTARELFHLVRKAVELARRSINNSRILVNDRMDIALACRAHGIHLPADSLPPRELRSFVPENFLIGVSCHEVHELVATESEGASFAVFGPVFAPLSKATYLPPRGLEQLRQAARIVNIPVYALGGISAENIDQCIDAGAAGVAGISLFQKDHS
jgi:thiamine-phosphate pyrophosphorylase